MCMNCSPRTAGLRQWLLAWRRPAWPARRRPLAAKKLPLIMIDPGHGGHDPGAIAPDGLFEKNITLATGLTLRHSLLATGRYRVDMTRATDVFVTLEGRVADAVAPAPICSSPCIATICPSRNLRGASVFTLSDNASDGLAASLANDENSADRSAVRHPRRLAAGRRHSRQPGDPRHPDRLRHPWPRISRPPLTASCRFCRTRPAAPISPSCATPPPPARCWKWAA